MTTAKKFWMVLVDNSDGCKHMHSSLGAAKQEVERLLQLPGNREKGATILEAMEYGTVPLVSVEFEPVER